MCLKYKNPPAMAGFSGWRGPLRTVRGDLVSELQPMNTRIEASSLREALSSILLRINDFVYFGLSGVGFLSAMGRLLGPSAGFPIEPTKAPLEWQFYLILLVFFSQIQARNNSQDSGWTFTYVFARVMETLSVLVAYYAVGLLWGYREFDFPLIFLGIAGMVFWILVRDGWDKKPFLTFLRLIGFFWFLIVGIAEFFSDLPAAFLLSASSLLLLVYVLTIILREAERIQEQKQKPDGEA